MKIAISSDLFGFDDKERIKTGLIELHDDVHEFGSRSANPVDDPDFLRPNAPSVSRAVVHEQGVVFGGPDNGEAMGANRIRGIRSALYWNIESARVARQHNDANRISLGQRPMDFALAASIVKIWLATPFDNGRHSQRIRKTDELTDGSSTHAR